ncbi:hypothetical protein [Chachezhania sediminis]|uniref:hypothetical protein n=1 Tax=Chachezhania sediminis TaxID=2599291 RepID=UPI00131BC349|nr:hypothetical protein [Chachezhania sediminis]
MKHFIITAALGACILVGMPNTADAGSIVERACRESARRAASESLCRCIQNVASKTLSRSEQRKVAKWFADPHKAQEARQSDRDRDEELWQRYRIFGETAARTCG